MTEVERRKFRNAEAADAYVMHTFEESLTPASVSANSVAQESFTVTGLDTTFQIMAVIPPASLNVAIGGFRQAGDDSVEITFCNPTAGALSPTSGTWRFIAISN